MADLARLDATLTRQQRFLGPALVGGISVPNQSTQERELMGAKVEGAALLWTEKLTLISTDHVPDEVYEQVRPHFTEEELANLTLAIVLINGWNRFGIAFHDVPGRYKPARCQ